MLRPLAFLLFATAALAQTTVERFDNEGPHDVNLTSGGIAVTSVSTITGPRNLIYAGQTWDCNTTGYYSFWKPPYGSGANRIVWAGDVDRLMSAFSWAHAWGTEDNGMAISAMTVAAGQRQLRVQCSKICTWAKAVCDSLGSIGGPPLQTRLVSVITAESPNSWYDGHVMLEAKKAGAWTLYDIANGIAYPAALKDVVPLVPGFPSSSLGSKTFSVNLAPSGTFNLAAWQLSRTNTIKASADILRVMQIPGIADGVASDGTGYPIVWYYTPPGMESRADWIRSLSPNFRVIPKSEWLARFYP